jgi:carbamoyl-phosphate synthase large subunit
VSNICVLVTGIGGGGLGHELVKSLRDIERYRIVGADTSAASFGRADVDAFGVLPRASDPGYIDRLLELCRRESVDALVVGSEPELIAVSAGRDRLDTEVLLLANSREVIALGLDKVATGHFLLERGFATPRFLEVDHSDAVPNEFPLPAVVKPSTGGGGSTNTFLVQERAELDFTCEYLIRQGLTIVVQEYVGTPDAEFTVGVLHTLDGHLVGSIALQRDLSSGLSRRLAVANRTSRAELSPSLVISSGISQGRVEDFPDIRRQCEELAEALGSRGPLNIQCRVVDGLVHTFEINPRFSGTSHFRAMLGFNELDLLIRHHLMHEDLPEPIGYRHGRIVRGLQERLVDDA